MADECKNVLEKEVCIWWTFCVILCVIRGVKFCCMHFLLLDFILIAFQTL